ACAGARPNSADARGERGPQTLRVDLGGSGVGRRLARRDERELARGVEALDRGALERLLGAHLGHRGEGDGKLELGDPLVGEGVCTRFAGEEGGPTVARGSAERRRGADTGDDDLLGHSSTPWGGGPGRG